MSNDDIVKRLLGGDSRPGHLYDARCPMCDDNRHKVGQQAADEIERLRAENAALRAAGDRLAEVLADYEGGRGPGDALRVDGATGWSVWIVGHDVVDAPTIRDALIAAVRRVADEVTR